MNNRIKKIVLSSGLLLGIIMATLFLIQYLIGLDTVGIGSTIKWSLMGFFISISMVVYFLLNFRKIENGGYLTFKEGFFLSFGIFAISTLLYTLFTLVFMNIIDPDYADQYQKKILNIVIESYEKANFTESEIDDAMEQIDDIAQFSLENMSQGYLVNLLFYALLSSVIALCTKKRKPEIFE